MEGMEKITTFPGKTNPGAASGVSPQRRKKMKIEEIKDRFLIPVEPANGDWSEKENYDFCPFLFCAVLHIYYKDVDRARGVERRVMHLVEMPIEGQKTLEFQEIFDSDLSKIKIKERNKKNK